MVLLKKISLLSICLIFTSFAFKSAPANTMQTMVFATSFPKESFFYKKYQEIYTEAFMRLGYQFELNVYPSKRLAQVVNSGIIDGDVSRIKQMHSGNRYPNMVRVDESITEMNISAFTHNKELKINRWDAFTQNNLKIAYPRGYRIVEINLPGVVDKSRIIEISDSLQGCRMLIGERFDVLIDVKRTIELLLQENEFKDHQVKHAGILETIILYPYLHKKNDYLVAKLAHTLKNMKEEGVFEQIVNSIK